MLRGRTLKAALSPLDLGMSALQYDANLKYVVTHLSALNQVRVTKFGKRRPRPPTSVTSRWPARSVRHRW